MPNNKNEAVGGCLGGCFGMLGCAGVMIVGVISTISFFISLF